MIEQGSRYRTRDLYTTRDPARDDAPIAGVVPHEPAPLSTGRIHRVVAGERLDHLADRYYGDPLKYHLIVDANDALFPEDLEVPGTILKIPLNPGT